MENSVLDAAVSGEVATKAFADSGAARGIPQEPSTRTNELWRDSHLADELYSVVAFPLCRHLAPVNPLIGYYHTVSDRELPHIQELYSFKTPAEFKTDIDFLLRHFKPISLREILLALEGGATLPSNSIHLTFDDGLAECFEVAAPILREKGVPATFFLCSAFVDNEQLPYDHKKSLLVSHLRAQRWTTAQQGKVRELLTGIGVQLEDLAAALLSVKHGQKAVLDRIAACVEVDFSDYLERVKPFLTSEQVFSLLKGGHSIGSHSIDHPRYSEIPLAEQLRQTRESSRIVKERFSLNYSVFSFPHSDAEVSLEFFREIFKDQSVDVTFGNRGLLDDPVEKNLQRNSLEKPRAHAKAILGRAYARRLARKIKGEAIIPRS